MVCVNAVLMGVQADTQHYGYRNVDWGTTSLLWIALHSCRCCPGSSHCCHSFFLWFTETVELFFTLFYILELFVKMISFGYIFFLDSWNVIDFVVVIFTCLAEFTAFAIGALSALRLDTDLALPNSICHVCLQWATGCQQCVSYGC